MLKSFIFLNDVKSPNNKNFKNLFEAKHFDPSALIRFFDAGRKLGYVFKLNINPDEAAKRIEEALKTIPPYYNVIPKWRIANKVINIKILDGNTNMERPYGDINGFYEKYFAKKFNAETFYKTVVTPLSHQCRDINEIYELNGENFFITSQHTISPRFPISLREARRRARVLRAISRREHRKSVCAPVCLTHKIFFDETDNFFSILSQVDKFMSPQELSPYVIFKNTVRNRNIGYQ